MKLLTIIGRASSRADLIDVLARLPEVSGFTVTSSEGHGRSGEEDPFESARDRVEGFVPRVRIELLVEESVVPRILEAIAESGSGRAGERLWWLQSLDEWGRI